MLNKLLGLGKSPPSAPSGPMLSSGLRSTIMNAVGAKSIPAMPASAQKAFQLSTDPNADAHDFVEVIESDEALSARLIKIANSVYFDRGQQSKTIEDCVTVIGINELRCILNANALPDLLPSKHSARPQLWENDIATAIISRELARRVMPEKEGLAFLGGLMHDIGKLLLIQRTPDQYSKVLHKIEQSGCSFSEAEEGVLAFNHTELGQIIAERWHFTPELIETIRNHHAPWPTQPTLTALVRAGDLIAHSLGLGHPRGFNQFRSNCESQLEPAWQMLRVEPAAQRSTLEDLKRSYQAERDLYMGYVK